MITKMKKLSFLAALAGLFQSAAHVQAATVVNIVGTFNTADFDSGGPYAVSTTDLINGNNGTQADMSTLFGPTPGFLTNGFSTVNTSAQQITYDPNGFTAVYLLGGTYNIGKIQVFGGWDAGQFRGQNYTVDVSSNGGGTWNPLGVTVNFYPGGSGGSYAQQNAPDGRYHRSTIEDNGGGAIATGINAMRFNFGNPPQGSDHQIITEIDVHEAAAVPEPSTAALAVLGVVGLTMLGGRRRRRA